LPRASPRLFDMTTDNAKELAEAIKSRRAELGLTMAQVARRGGPTKPTQVKYERGHIPDGSQAGTLRKYDIALGWTPGHASSLLGVAGGQDNVVHLIPDLPPAPREMAEKGTGWIVDSSKLHDLMSGISRLRKQLAEMPEDIEIPSGVIGAMANLSEAQAELLMDRLGERGGATSEDAG
jgi:hypothetical protein